MKNKLLLVLLSLMLVVGLLSGCSSKDPKELLKDATINSQNIKTSRQIVELGIKLDAEMDDPMAQGIIQAVNDSKIKIELDTDTENKKFKGNVTLDLKGFGTSFNGEIYGNEDIVIVKVPMFPQYLYIELDEETKKMFEGNTSDEEVQKEMKALVSKLIDELLNEVKDENITMDKNVAFKTQNGEEKLTKIELTLNDQELKDLVKKAIKLYFENDAFKNIMKEQLKAQGQIQTDEEFDIMIKDMMNELDTGFEEVNNVLNFKTFKTIYHIDDKDFIRGSEFEMGLDVNVEEENINASVVFEGKTETWDINKDIEIEIPEIDKDQSLNILDLINEQANMFGY